MSTINVEVVELGEIKPHPNAERLEIAQVLGTECCVQKDAFKVGDRVFWFPPGILIPEWVANNLGVANYLKHSTYPGDTVQSKCRVAACRLRGVASFGFVAAMSAGVEAGGTNPEVGSDASSIFQAHKYEPPPERAPGIPRPKGFNGDAEATNEHFHKYTDIQHFYKYQNAIPEGEIVRITEKLHGSNVRLGLVRNEIGDFQFMAGSREVTWKPEDQRGNIPIWWQFMTEEVVNLLTTLCDEQHDVVIYGEVFGPGVQDMDYGVEELTFRVFDIAVNGRYVDWADLHTACVAHGVATVPLLYLGPFSKEVLKQHTDGPTELAPAEKIKSKFKAREGCVVTPVVERVEWHGRTILKSVSADYLDRKGAQDN